MSKSDRSDEFDLETELGEDLSLDVLGESLVDSSLAKEISDILASIVLPVNGDVDIRATSTEGNVVFADLGGVVFISGDLAAPFGSGTGNYSPFLSLRDSNQGPADADGVATGFNVDSTSDPLLNDLIFGNSRTNAVQLSNLVITVIDGKEFLKFVLT